MAPAMTTPDKKPLSETVRTIGALSTVGFSFVLAIVWCVARLARRQVAGDDAVAVLSGLRDGARGGYAERLPDIERVPEVNGG